MKIPDFTLPEVEFYREFCNFDEQEERLFFLRTTKKMPLERCAEDMHCDISTVKNISRRVNKKIIKMADSDRVNQWIDKVYWPKMLNK